MKTFASNIWLQMFMLQMNIHTAKAVESAMINVAMQETFSTSYKEFISSVNSAFLWYYLRGNLTKHSKIEPKTFIDWKIFQSRFYVCISGTLWRAEMRQGGRCFCCISDFCFPLQNICICLLSVITHSGQQTNYRNIVPFDYGLWNIRI